MGFLKAANTFVGHRARTFRPADVAFMHYECELAVVIGKTARNVRRDQAYDHVAGYTVANDYALRDYLENWYRPNLRVKSRDTCTPLGPWLVDRDDIPDPMNLTLSTHVNGVRTQLGNTRDMVFDVPALIEYFSSFMTLSPGDLILTGTPDGIVNVKPGDEVVTEIEGVGRLVNTLVPCPPDIPHSWNLSMLDTATVRALAARLHEAERTRTQIRQISLDHPDIGIPDAYAIQKAWMEIKLAEGRVKRGHKIGLTSRAMQQASQIDEPDFGMLLDDMFFQDGAEIPAGRFILPRLEVELAFVLGKRLQGPNVTLFQVYDAVDYVIPALEIIDARSHGIDPDSKRPRKVFDTIADNAANAGVVLGGRPVKIGELDLRWIGAILSRNAVIERPAWPPAS